jgi:hypothetical protein
MAEVASPPGLAEMGGSASPVPTIARPVAAGSGLRDAGGDALEAARRGAGGPDGGSAGSARADAESEGAGEAPGNR